MSAPAEWPPPGYTFAWTPTTVAEPGTNWEALPPNATPRSCRYRTSPTGVCEGDAVARMRLVANGHVQWRYFCEAHLYGRRLRDGVLVTAVLVPIGGVA